MEIWKLIWMFFLLAGVMSFVYISFTVIIKGFAEVRELLKEMLDTPV